MASGFTKDDFVPLDDLVQQASNSCIAAASVFEDLSQDLNAIHRFLEHLIKQANNPNSLLIQRCQDRRKDWLYILETLTYAICELQEHISTYYEVGPDIWLQADDAQRHFNNLRSEVMVGYDAVDTFVDSLGLSPAARKDYTLGQIEKLLISAVREERAGTANYGILETVNGTGGGPYRIQRYLRNEGIDEAEIQRHDARTKQVLIWVVENEPALTDLFASEEKMEGMSKEEECQQIVETEKAKRKSLAPEFGDEEEKIGEHNEDSRQEVGNRDSVIKNNESGKEEEISNSNESGKEEEDLELTAILVDRRRTSTTARPDSVATSTSSFVETDAESSEPEWELV